MLSELERLQYKGDYPEDKSKSGSTPREVPFHPDPNVARVRLLSIDPNRSMSVFPAEEVKEYIDSNAARVTLLSAIENGTIEDPGDVLAKSLTETIFSGDYVSPEAHKIFTRDREGRIGAMVQLTLEELGKSREELSDYEYHLLQQGVRMKIPN